MPHTRLLAAILLASAALASPAAAQPSRCMPQESDGAWIQGAVESWTAARRDDLRLGSAELPWIVLFDASCTWQINRGSTASPLTGTPHDGHISIPDGNVIDAAVTSFAATYGPDDRPFLVMALPSVWRKEPRHAANPDLERLMRSVFAHEMTHTEQAHGTAVQLREIDQRSPLPADLTDDIIQQRFAEVPGFREAYETERDLLFRAAAEPDAPRRRALATQALDAIMARRARYFSGADATYADLEDLFLNMEGVANWAGYRVALREIKNSADAITFMRRARSWSQDEGLALFLVIDSLLPDWQPAVFGATPGSAFELLRKATNPIG
jgi:hypothetical protein